MITKIMKVMVILTTTHYDRSTPQQHQQDTKCNNGKCNNDKQNDKSRGDHDSNNSHTIQQMLTV